MEKITLFKILVIKEKIHWKRTSDLFKKFNGWLNKLTFGLIAVIVGIIVHYAFVFMHTAFEVFLWVFFRETFKNNLKKISIKLGLIK